VYKINPFGHWFQLTDIFGSDESPDSKKPQMTPRAAEMAFRLAAKTAGAGREKKGKHEANSVQKPKQRRS
jgi:hypothetical protein